MKSISKIVAIILVLVVGLLVYIANDDQEVFVESRESKSASGGVVFNIIKYIQSGDLDIWMMNQSHHGFSASEKSWDRLAIVIDKNRTPKVARFYQLTSGPLEWSEKFTETSFKVSCFVCHNNGPRVIRPNYESPFDPSSFWDKIKISYWNFKIKSYGRVLTDSHHDEADKTQVPPFRYRSPYENEPLKVATCIKCHKESGFLARGLLRRQQISTIKFMLDAGQMPPLGFQMSIDEKRELEAFLDGF